MNISWFNTIYEIALSFKCYIIVINLLLKTVKIFFTSSMILKKMTNFIEPIFYILFIITFSLHIATFCFGYLRSREKPFTDENVSFLPPISIIRPVCGLEEVEKSTLESTFYLNYPKHEIIFCAADPEDPSIEYIKGLISRFPNVNARLLIGDSRVSPNPKLNNIFKGWADAIYEFIVLVDSNVSMPKNYLQQLLIAWDNKTGLVCSPPVGSDPKGFWAEVECAFLNTYQARWQLAADTVGFGFAQGKSMLWCRSDLEKAGGILSLDRDVAEDAAATKIVREAGKKVKLVNSPFLQPLGYRAFTQVWNRQLRWARLRRVTFPIYFIPEILSGSFFSLLSLIIIVRDLGLFPSIILIMAVMIIWFALEGMYAKIYRWHITWISPLAWITRDLLIPIIWFFAWAGNNFTWRGNLIDITVQKNRPVQTLPILSKT